MIKYKSKTLVKIEKELFSIYITGALRIPSFEEMKNKRMQ